MLRRVFSQSMALSSGVIFAHFFWASRTPCSISGVHNACDLLSASVNIAGSLIIVASILPGRFVGDGDLVGDATWDALSSSVSCFKPFLVTLFVACDRSMVSVFVLSSGLSNFVGTVCFVNKVFGLLRVCVACPVKVRRSDKLLK